MPTAEQVDKKMQRRVQAIGSSSYRKVIETRPCYETGAGVVLTQSAYGEARITAHLFNPRQLKTAFAEIQITTAHERISVLDTLHEMIADKKAEKVAPHNLQVGDVIAQIWGSTMQGVNFHVVADIPHPRKVSLVAVPSRYVKGDFMGGSKVPDISPGEIPSGERNTFMVEMRRDNAYVKMSDYDRVAKWDGNPVMVYSD
tara:strand:+ start:3118 stop:3717 length:600 start_codon:yes stop_codon:yes gene_type:complete